MSLSLYDNEFERRKERLPFENQWKLNVNLLEGKSELNPVSQPLEEVPRVFDWQEREVFDMIAPNIETRLSRLSRMRPVLKVRPGSSDPDDMRSTKVGNHLLKNLYYDKRMQSKQADLNAWMEITGTCLMKHVWNPELGQLVGHDETVVDMQGNPIPQEVHEGDLRLSCPRRRYSPDSKLQEIESCRSIIRQGFSCRQIEEVYGKKVAPETLSVMQLRYPWLVQAG